MRDETTHWRIEIVRTELKEIDPPRYFVGNAQLLRRLMTVEKSLAANTKVVVPANTELINIIGDMAGLLPIGRGAPPAEGHALHRGGSDLPSALAETARHLPHA